MYCPKCNSYVADGNRFCGSCGAEISSSPSETNSPAAPDQPYGNTQYSYQQNGQPYNNYGYNQPPVEENESTTIYKVLSFLWPVVGIIIYFIDRDKRPKRAKDCLKFSIISIVVSMIFAALVFIGSFLFAFFGMSEIDEGFIFDDEYVEYALGDEYDDNYVMTQQAPEILEEEVI